MSDVFSAALENLNQVVDVIRSNFLTIAIGLAAIAWSLLILPDSLSELLHFQDLRQSQLTAIGAVAYLSTALLILWILFQLARLIYAYFRARFELPRLTDDERIRLRKYVTEISHTQGFFLTDGVVSRLIQKGLIYKADSKPNSAMEQDYHIYPWIYRRLTSQPNMLDPMRDERS